MRAGGSSRPPGERAPLTISVSATLCLLQILCHPTLYNVCSEPQLIQFGAFCFQAMIYSICMPYKKTCLCVCVTNICLKWKLEFYDHYSNISGKMFNTFIECWIKLFIIVLGCKITIFQSIVSIWKHLFHVSSAIPCVSILKISLTNSVRIKYKSISQISNIYRRVSPLVWSIQDEAGTGGSFQDEWRRLERQYSRDTAWLWQ